MLICVLAISNLPGLLVASSQQTVNVPILGTQVRQIPMLPDSDVNYYSYDLIVGENLRLEWKDNGSGSELSFLSIRPSPIDSGTSPYGGFLLISKSTTFILGFWAFSMKFIITINRHDNFVTNTLSVYYPPEIELHKSFTFQPNVTQPSTISILADSDSMINGYTIQFRKAGLTTVTIRASSTNGSPFLSLGINVTKSQTCQFDKSRDLTMLIWIFWG